MLLTRELIISDCNMTPEFSYVNIIAPLVQKSAQKKRNFGVCCVFSRFSLRRQRKKSAIFVEVARRTDSLTKSRKRHLRQYPKHAKTLPHRPPLPPSRAMLFFPTQQHGVIAYADVRILLQGVQPHLYLLFPHDQYGEDPAMSHV